MRGADRIIPEQLNSIKNNDATGKQNARVQTNSFARNSNIEINKQHVIWSGRMRIGSFPHDPKRLQTIGGLPARPSAANVCTSVRPQNWKPHCVTQNNWIPNIRVRFESFRHNSKQLKKRGATEPMRRVDRIIPGQLNSIKVRQAMGQQAIACKPSRCPHIPTNKNWNKS